MLITNNLEITMRRHLSYTSSFIMGGHAWRRSTSSWKSSHFCAASSSSWKRAYLFSSFSTSPIWTWEEGWREREREREQDQFDTDSLSTKHISNKWSVFIPEQPSISFKLYYMCIVADERDDKWQCCPLRRFAINLLSWLHPLDTVQYKRNRKRWATIIDFKWRVFSIGMA